MGAIGYSHSDHWSGPDCHPSLTSTTAPSQTTYTRDPLSSLDSATPATVLTSLWPLPSQHPKPCFQGSTHSSISHLGCPYPGDPDHLRTSRRLSPTGVTRAPEGEPQSWLVSSLVFTDPKISHWATTPEWDLLNGTEVPSPTPEPNNLLSTGRLDPCTPHFLKANRKPKVQGPQSRAALTAAQEPVSRRQKGRQGPSPDLTPEPEPQGPHPWLY